MKIYKTQIEIENDIKNGELFIDGDVKFECSFTIEASLRINGHIFADTVDINAWNINVLDINAENINARDINADNINVLDINADNINAGNINAKDIKAGDINAFDINADNILYYAFCSVYKGIRCLSIKAKREKAQEPVCLDGKLEIKHSEQTSAEKEAIELLKSKGFKIIKE